VTTVIGKYGTGQFSLLREANEARNAVWDQQIRCLVKKWWGIDGCSDSWLPETREYALGHSIRILDAAGFTVLPKAEALAGNKTSEANGLPVKL
jgi:hypothetical protein